MRHTVLNLREIVAGLFIVVLGAFAVYEATHYEIGTVAHMGPGFYPLVLGLFLIGLGLLLSVLFMHAEAEELGFPLRAFLLIASGILAFALLLERAGLVPATVAVVVLSSLADRTTRLATIAASAAFLSLFGVAIFIWGLRLPLVPFRW